MRYPNESSIEEIASNQESEFQLLCQELEFSSLDHVPQKLSSSTTFHRFPYFPLEIRQLIWRHAFSDPQLHIVSEEVATYSRISVIMQACKEAYQEGLYLDLPYYTAFSYGRYDEDSYGHQPLPRHYMQPHLDTLWIAVKGSRTIWNCFVPTALSFYRGSRSYRQVRTLVINDSCWIDPERLGDNKWNPGSLDWIPYDMCEEIAIVLNNLAMPMDREVIFTEPSPPPGDLISGDLLSLDGSSDSRSYYGNAMARSAVMEDFRTYQSENRKQTGTEGLLDWQVPRVRFVEAKLGNPYATPLKCTYWAKPKNTALMGVIPNTWSRDNISDWAKYLGTKALEEPRMTGCRRTRYAYFCQDCSECPDRSTYSDNSEKEDPDPALDDEPREFDSQYTSDSEEESDPDASEDAGLGVFVPLPGERTSFSIPHSSVCLTFPPTLPNSA